MKSLKMNLKGLKVSNMLVKICGITEIEEIEELNKLKPDYVGFVFAESKRKVNKEYAKIMISKLNKDIKSVGVFRNNKFNEILSILKEIRLDVIQLHGDEDEDFIYKLKEKTNCEIWKAFSVRSYKDLLIVNKYPVDTILLDGSEPGSGEVFPWEILKKSSISKNVLLAGGINEDNITEAINKIRPYGIDVSSGVESINRNGQRLKDKIKMEKLIKKVRESNEGKI